MKQEDYNKAKKEFEGSEFYKNLKKKVDNLNKEPTTKNLNAVKNLNFGHYNMSTHELKKQGQYGQEYWVKSPIILPEKYHYEILTIIDIHTGKMMPSGLGCTRIKE